MKAFVIFLLLTLFSSFSWAQASTCYNYDIENTEPSEVRVDVAIKCMVKGDTLYLDGAVDPWLIDELIIYPLEPIKHISLNSGGGLAESSFEIAKFVRKNKITTHVRAGAVCKSACTLIYQAGVKRTAHPSAVFMYHSARYLRQTSEQREDLYKCIDSSSQDCINLTSEKTRELQETTDQLFSLYASYGVSENFYDLYKSLPDDPQWYEVGNYLKTEDWEMYAPETMVHGIVQELMD